MLDSIFSGGIIKRALDKGLLEVHVHNLRDFTTDRHRQVDDRPFGGREGMVLKPEPIFRAVEKVRSDGDAPVYLLSPQGKTFDYKTAEELARNPQVVLICGRYEGVDERVIEDLVTAEISIGDFVLSGGEPAAIVVVDAVSRLVPGVVGKTESVRNESFFAGLLDFPQFTRPREFRGMRVPQVLFSGDHGKIESWRRKKALEKTWRLRPDILEKRELTREDREILDEIRRERKER